MAVWLWRYGDGYMAMVARLGLYGLSSMAADKLLWLRGNGIGARAMWLYGCVAMATRLGLLGCSYLATVFWAWPLVKAAWRWLYVEGFMPIYYIVAWRWIFGFGCIVMANAMTFQCDLGVIQDPETELG